MQLLQCLRVAQNRHYVLDMGREQQGKSSDLPIFCTLGSVRVEVHFLALFHDCAFLEVSVDHNVFIPINKGEHGGTYMDVLTLVNSLFF